MNKLLAAQRASLVLLIVNAVGAVVYVIRASASWRNPAEHGMIPVTGEPLVWFGAILPLLGVYLLLNLTWAGFIVARRQWRSGRLWLVTAAVWLCAVAIDFAHH